MNRGARLFRLYGFRVGFGALAILSVVGQDIVAALVLIAITIAYVGEARWVIVTVDAGKRSAADE